MASPRGEATTESPSSIKYLLPYVYTGCGLSIFAVVCAIIYFVAQPRLRIKRTSIVTVNVCVSLLIFYIGYVILIHSSEESSCFDGDAKASNQCLVGAIMMLLSWLCIGLWICLEWGYFAYTLKRPRTKHISNFCCKTSCFVYVSSVTLLIVLMTIFAVSSKNAANSGEVITTASVTTTVSSVVTATAANVTAGSVKANDRLILLPFMIMLGGFFGMIVLGSFFCFLRIYHFPAKNTSQIKLKKARIQFTRLLAITIVISGTNAPFIILWATESPEGQLYQRIVATSIVCNALQGLLIAFVLFIHRDDDKLQRRTAKQMRNQHHVSAVSDPTSAESFGGPHFAGTINNRFSATDEHVPRFQPRDASLLSDNKLFHSLQQAAEQQSSQQNAAEQLDIVVETHEPQTSSTTAQKKK